MNIDEFHAQITLSCAACFRKFTISERDAETLGDENGRRCPRCLASGFKNDRDAWDG